MEKQPFRDVGWRRKYTPFVVLLLMALGIFSAVLLTSDSRGVAGLPSWPAPSAAKVVGAVHQAGLRILPAEGTKTHVHSHLTITVDGQRLVVPALVGIDESRHLYSEIHTHDTSGILHVESARVADFKLGQFLTEWQVAADTGQLGSYVNGRQGVRLGVFLNGRPWSGDLRKIELRNHANISIDITTNGATPKPAQAFIWPKGY